MVDTHQIYVTLQTNLSLGVIYSKTSILQHTYYFRSFSLIEWEVQLYTWIPSCPSKTFKWLQQIGTLEIYILTYVYYQFINIGMNIETYKLIPNHKVDECVPIVGTFNSTNLYGVESMSWETHHPSIDERGRMPVGSPVNCKFHDTWSGFFL